MEALQRLNKGKPKDTKVPKWKQKKQQQQKDRMDVDEETNGVARDPAEAVRRKAVEAITGAADALYSREQHDIYDTEREMLMRQFKRETGDEWVPPPVDEDAGAETTADDVRASEMWEYRWSDASNGETHGPYGGPTMKAWSDAGYFGEGVEFRRRGESDWSRVLDVR